MKELGKKTATEMVESATKTVPAGSNLKEAYKTLDNETKKHPDLTKQVLNLFKQEKKR